jgi:hypothetical protein
MQTFGRRIFVSARSNHSAHLHMWALSVGVMLCLTAAGSVASEPQSLLSAIRSHLKLSMGSETPVHVFALTNLDNDGVPDAVVLLTDRAYCGSGGCTVEVYRGTPLGFTFVCGSTLSSKPILVSPESSHGWKTLIVASKRSGSVLMSFDGRRYPLNPSMQPRASDSQIKAATILLGR